MARNQDQIPEPSQRRAKPKSAGKARGASPKETNARSRSLRGPGKAALIVLGMHRSGTSALAGALGLCGAWLGEDQELTGSNPENPTGFWERRDVRAVCDRLLHAAGADWWKVASFEPAGVPYGALVEQGRAFRKVVAELNSHHIWALKEPRLCLLFPVLRSFISNPICIHISRNPLDVAKSLRARNGFGIAEGLALWETYTISALQASAGLPRVLVSYEALVSRPEETLGALVRELEGLGVTDLAPPETEAITEFISPSLHRQRSGLTEAADFLLPSQDELWSLLKSGEALRAELPGALSHVARQHLRDLESRKLSIDQLKARDGEAKDLAARLHRRTQDVQQLVGWIEALDLGMAALVATRRWKASSALGEVARRVRMKPRMPTAQDHLTVVFDRFRAWQDARPSRRPAVAQPPLVRHGMTRGATIIICVHNALSDVKACLDSVDRNTDLKRHRLMIVDDGSESETADYVVHRGAQLGAAYLRNQVARGYTRAANQGLRASDTDFMVLLNSDAIVTPLWLERLLGCAASFPDAAVVGPLSNAASWQSIPDRNDTNGKWMVNQLPDGVDLDAYAAALARRSPQLYPKVRFVNGFCYMISRHALDIVGYLDEDSFPQGYGEEDDFSIRSMDAGLALYIADDAYVFHHKSKSFTSQGREDIVRVSKERLAAKHEPKRIKAQIGDMRVNESLVRALACAKANVSIADTHAPQFPVDLRKHSPLIGWLQPHLDTVGGIRRAIEMTNRLTQWGAKVVLITPDGSKTDWLPILSEVSTIAAVRHTDFDVLIISDPDVIDSFYEIKARVRIKYHLAAYMLYRTKNTQLKRYYEDESNVLHAANSAWTAEQVRRHCGITVQQVFPGGIDPKLFQPVRVETTHDVAIYGSGRPHKGTADILAATKRHRVLQLASLEAPQNQLARHICSARVFVSAAWHEGFNFCPLEAMACGVPVVMTDCGGSREYARNDHNALVVRPRDMAAAIDTLLTDPELRVTLIENGIRTASGFRWDDVTSKFGRFVLDQL